MHISRVVFDNRAEQGGKGKWLMNQNIHNWSEFERQAAYCRNAGSPVTAAVIETLTTILDDSSATGRRILNWPGDASADALPIRLAGGLHALARRGDDDALAALYRGATVNLKTTLKKALLTNDDWLCDWLKSPPQTNEVMRCSGLMAGLMVIADRIRQPIALLELGSSAGLNLNLDRFRYTLGNCNFGPSRSPVYIKPEWIGDSPPNIIPQIVSRAGVDIAPIDVFSDAAVERLLAYVWAGQTARSDRLEAAIKLARTAPVPVQVAQGDAIIWLKDQLTLPQPADTTRVIMHSVFWQYLPAAARQQLVATIKAAGAHATDQRPLAWLMFEPFDTKTPVMRLNLQIWPSGDELCLADCQAHGLSINWK